VISTHDRPGVLPTGFPNAGDFSLQAQEPETDAAHLEPPQKAVHAPAQAAAMIAAGLEFRLGRRFIPERQSRHK